MAPTFYIIDGHAQIYRAYYAPFRNLTSPAGEPTRATYVFWSMLLNLVRQRRPDYLAMVLDVSDATVFRCDLYPDYKANREAPPEDLPPQAQRIVSTVQAAGIPVFAQAGFEADDLMATIVQRLADQDVHIHLVSRDKDLEQLLGPRVSMYDPTKDAVIDAAGLHAEKGYHPEQAVEVQTLAGDGVDNIPGVVGVGVKTAARLIAQYGSAQAVLEHADELTPRQRENVRAFAEQMPITRQLVTLRRDVAFDFDLEATRFRGLRVAQVRPIFAELGLSRLREQLDDLGAGLFAAEPEGEAGPAKSVMSPFPAVTAEPVTAAAVIPAAAPGTYHLIDTTAKLADLVSRMHDVREFAVDTETTSLNPVAGELVGISLCWQSGTGYYLPVRSMLGAVLPLEEVRARLGPFLADAGIRKVGQNIKYDLVVLRQAGFEVQGVAFDTMIAAFLLDPLRRSHGLDALALEEFGYRKIPTSDLIGRGRDQITMDLVHPERICEYAGEDADFTWRLKERFAPQIQAGSMRALFEETEMPLVDVLAVMEANGVALDSARLAQLSGELIRRLADLAERIYSSAGRRFNIDSPRQLATVLFDELGLPTIRETKTQRSTDAETLETLVRDTGHPLAGLVLEYRELIKLQGTYVGPLPDMVCRKTGRVHAGFHQTGAVTGRLSSSDPNLQNIPVRTELGRRIRAAFVAGEPARRLLVADYSQIELRVLAHFSGDESLCAAFQTNQDIHRFVAAQVHGVAPEEVTHAQRSAAKAVNFGIIYGQTPFGLARTLNISQTAAREFIERYHARYPGIRRFVEECVAATRARGYAETILGRRRPIPELNSRNRPQAALGERLAVNTVIQGSAADLIKRAMVDIHRDIQARGSSTRLLIQVHDELVCEVAADQVETERECIRAKMVGAIPLNVPIVVDIGVGENWLEAK